MVRGTGKFKTKRGGGRNFSKHLVLDEDGTAVATDPRRARKTDDGDDADADSDEDEEEESEASSSDSPPAPSSSVPQPELTRAERRELKKKQAAAKHAHKPTANSDGEEDGDGDDADLINPNHVEKKLNISDLGAPRELTRKEREAKEKQEAKDRYWKLHVAGKTAEAKSDLARLQKIRAEREAAQAKRKAEAEAKAAEVEAKKKAAANGKRI
ncbi:casein kinase substrate phosphoprotein PP28-domain-containing protein [Phlebopus sp. FC_14]|nr:casein kinase substrate phosphoprotein PP28-domain-containing protein [Phlebopus sp. FC_14]